MVNVTVKIAGNIEEITYKGGEALDPEADVFLYLEYKIEDKLKSAEMLERIAHNLRNWE